MIRNCTTRTTIAMLLFLATAPAAAQEFNLAEATVVQINNAFDAGVLTAEKLTRLYLNRIEAYDQQGPAINSIITLNVNALETARALDRERETSGPRSPLHGIPILLKDNMDTFDMPTTGGSLALRNSVPPDDGFIVRRLREAGAIILGKTNMDELAAGDIARSSLGGQTLNPYRTNVVTGGSSGGTAAAIAANFAVLGTGTDTVGSIREPAFYNALVGLKPTLGLTSRDGIIPLTLTRDVAGPMVRTVMDAAIFLDVVAGVDPADPITVASEGRIPPSYLDSLKLDQLQGARIGVVREFLDRPGRSRQIDEVINAAIDDMRNLGAEIIDLDIGFDLRPLHTYYNSFKYDINNYLASLGDDAPVHNLQELIASKQYLPSLDFFPFSWNAQRDISPEESRTYPPFLQRRAVTEERILNVMDDLQIDALVYPDVTRLPPRTGGFDPLPDLGLNADLASFLGYPAITVPAGFTSSGIPVGIEFMGRAFDEPTILGLAFAFEQATLHRIPPASTPPLRGEVLVLGGVKGDFNGNDILDTDDIDVLTSQLGTIEARYDMNLDGSVDEADLVDWIHNLGRTWFGDANLDGDFDSGDLVAVLAAGEYEDGIVLNSGWADGDWTGDGEFTTSDLVAAFKDGGYEQGPRTSVSAVPEPNSFAILLLCSLIIVARCRPSRT